MTFDHVPPGCTSPPEGALLDSKLEAHMGSWKHSEVCLGTCWGSRISDSGYFREIISLVKSQNPTADTPSRECDDPKINESDLLGNMTGMYVIDGLKRA